MIEIKIPLDGKEPEERFKKTITDEAQRKSEIYMAQVVSKLLNPNISDEELDNLDPSSITTEGFSKKDERKERRNAIRYHDNLKELCMDRFGLSPYKVFSWDDGDDSMSKIPLKRGTLNNIQHGEFPSQQRVKDIIVQCFNDIDKECVVYQKESVLIRDEKNKIVEQINKVPKTFTPPKTLDENGEIKKIGINTYWDFILRVKYGNPSNYPCSPEKCVDRFTKKFSNYSAKDRAIYRKRIILKLRINSKSFQSEWDDALNKKNKLIMACADKIEEVFNWPYNTLLSDNSEDYTYARDKLSLAEDFTDLTKDDSTEADDYFLDEGRPVELTMEYTTELADLIFKHCRNVFLEFPDRNIVIMKSKDSNKLRILTDKSAAEALRRVGDDIVLGDRMLIDDVEPDC